MCVVSMLGDHYRDKWSPYFPYPLQRTITGPATDNPVPGSQQRTIATGPSQIDFDNLKKEVEEMKELLRKAKVYDEENNEPNCEIEEKMTFLREIADMVGIDLDDVLKKKSDGND